MLIIILILIGAVLLFANKSKDSGYETAPAKIDTIVEDPDTIPMSVQLPTREEKILEKEEAKNHHQERGGVEMIVMNEDPHGEARIRKGRTSHQGATQNEDIKLMLVNGYPAPTPTITPKEVITPTPNILKMKVLSV